MIHRAAIALLLLLSTSLLWLLGGAEAMPPRAVDSVCAEATLEGACAAAPSIAAVVGPVVREPAVNGVDLRWADPGIWSGLGGFVGRVVDATGRPVADCGVRLYRWAGDAIAALDPATLEAATSPRGSVVEVRTGEGGRFQFDRIWPRGFHLLIAGLGTDQPTHLPVERSPAPGEVVDLGDVALAMAGVLTGVVVDEAGAPLAGVLVQAADVPPSTLQVFPFEHFDPGGVVLVRGARGGTVIELPPWVADAYGALPIASARSGNDGTFRVVGVPPGSNLVVAALAGFAADVRFGVRVVAGQSRDLEPIRLRRGNAVRGRVVNTAGHPVAGAQVVAASTTAAQAFVPGRRLPATDALGRFVGSGFGNGLVTVAVRRLDGPWFVMAPQPSADEIVVTLPNGGVVEVEVRSVSGEPVNSARLQLLPDRKGPAAIGPVTFGPLPPIDLVGRQQVVGSGQWRLLDVPPGDYTLVVDAHGHASNCAGVRVGSDGARVALQLEMAHELDVIVVDPDQEPIPHAQIMVHGVLPDRPLAAGCTNAEGRVTVEHLPRSQFVVTAEHPRWGRVQGTGCAGAALRLQMTAPGSLHGVLRDGGRAPAPGRFTIAVARQPDGSIGASSMSMLLAPAADGSFEASCLQPGVYKVTAVPALGALRSAGALVQMGRASLLAGESQEIAVAIESGQSAEVALDIGEGLLAGPTARLGGTVQVNGQAAVGYDLAFAVADRSFHACADEQGRFDFGDVPVGAAQLVLQARDERSLFGGPGDVLWADAIMLAPGEQRELAIVVATSFVAGICEYADGMPAAGVLVRAAGRPRCGGGELRFGTTTDATGAFRFAQVADGEWVFAADDTGGSGQSAVAMAVNAGVRLPKLRLHLQPTAAVSGRVVLANVAADAVLTLSFHRLAGAATDAEGIWTAGALVDASTGEFRCDDLLPGRYQVVLQVALPQGDLMELRCPSIEVSANGVCDLRLQPLRATKE